MKRWLVLALLLPLGACGYNRIQTLDEQAASKEVITKQWDSVVGANVK